MAGRSAGPRNAACEGCQTMSDSRLYSRLDDEELAADMRMIEDEVRRRKVHPPSVAWSEMELEITKLSARFDRLAAEVARRATVWVEAEARSREIQDRDPYRTKIGDY